VLRPGNRTREDFLRRDAKLSGQYGDVFIGRAQAVAGEFGFHGQGVLDQWDGLIGSGSLDLDHGHERILSRRGLVLCDGVHANRGLVDCQPVRGLSIAVTETAL